MRIMFVSAEVAPFSKVCGLAAVMGSLPKVLEKMGHEVAIFTPLYGCINQEKFGITDVENSKLTIKSSDEFKQDGYYNYLKGFYIVNGYTKNEEVFKANSRVKKLKLTIDDKEEYIIELEDTMNPQLIDIKYEQESSWDKVVPITATFEILEVYPGEKYEDTAITTILGCVGNNIVMISG
jgi:hypothetical protein